MSGNVSHIRIFSFILLVLCSGLQIHCHGEQFTGYHVESFDTVPVTLNQSKTISFQNQSEDDVQRVMSIGFNGGDNPDGHFRIDSVAVGDKSVGLQNIVIPPKGFLNVKVTYEPRNLVVKPLGKWERDHYVEPRFKPYIPDRENDQQKEVAEEDAVHRAMFLILYEYPKAGVQQVELMGRAIPGPEGELSLPEVSAGPCVPEEGLACFVSDFEISIPKLFPETTKIELPAPIQINLAGSDARLRMDLFPPALLVITGNGPGEPLEGQPVDAVSLVITGVRGLVASGTFDGANLDLKDVAFRIRVVIGEITLDDINENMPAIVEFNIEDLNLTTLKPLVGSKMTLGINAQLSETPSGNPIFDQFLGGAEIVVELPGEMQLP